MIEENTFTWISFEDPSIHPEENETCIVCMDCPNELDWHLQIAHYYLEGATLSLVDKHDSTHTFHIKQDGFYIVQETSEKPKVFMAHGVKFWTILPTPKIKPDDILTIE